MSESKPVIFLPETSGQDRVAIFHYGGHAGSYELLLGSRAFALL